MNGWRKEKKNGRKDARRIGIKEAMVGERKEETREGMEEATVDKKITGENKHRLTQFQASVPIQRWGLP